MNTRHNLSIAQEIFSKKSIYAISVIIIILTNIASLDPKSAHAADGLNPRSIADMNVNELFDFVQHGDGEHAVQTVAGFAVELGGWGPAPGDEVKFDYYMGRNIRGAVQDHDDVTANCSNDPLVTFDYDSCVAEFESNEREVRFGQSLFSTRQDDRSELIRDPNDVMSTYIEETGHSWQEYLYETDGRGDGERIHTTSYEQALYWSAGREYQIKRYILNLDGDLLNLSDDQREALLNAICIGYANPIGNEVPSYGAPDGWPRPEVWPTENPSLDDFTTFCGSHIADPDF